MGIAAAMRRVAPARTPEAHRAVQRYERISRPAIIAAAVLPLLVSPGDSRHWANVVSLLSWLVFVIDLVVHSRLMVRYLASKFGVMDLAIVVITAPWYLIPGVEVGVFVVLARLARLARVMVVARGARRLVDRLGRAALFAVLAVLLFAFIAWRAETAVNPEFSSYGNAVWWACATISTVGYGDIVPVTVPGRVAGVLLMTVGIALLGVLAGSLASFFRLTPEQQRQDDARPADDLGFARGISGAELQQRQDDARPADDPRESGLVVPGDPVEPAEPVEPAGSDAGQPEPPSGTPQTVTLAQLREEVAELRLEIGRLSDVLGSGDAARGGPGPRL